VVKALNFPVRDTRARATGISCFLCQTTDGVSFVSPLLPALFIPLYPSLQAAHSREIAHMQAGQCGNRMGDVRATNMRV
jgi:hypothetical protein